MEQLFRQSLNSRNVSFSVKSQPMDMGFREMANLLVDRNFSTFHTDIAIHKLRGATLAESLNILL